MKTHRIILLVVAVLVALASGCSDSDVSKSSGSLKTDLMKKAAEKFFLDTVPMKPVQPTGNSAFVESVKKSLDVGGFYPIVPFCDTTVVFFMITSEQTMSSVINRETAAALLDDVVSMLSVNSFALYRSNEPLGDGSVFYKLVLSATYEYEAVEVVVGFVVLDGKVNSIYLY